MFSSLYVLVFLFKENESIYNLLKYFYSAIFENYVNICFVYVNSDTHCSQTLFLLFKCAIHCTKELFVSTANRSLVGTLMTIGDVSLSIAILIRTNM